MQQFLVILLVFAATALSVWKLMPARGRLRSLQALDRWLARHQWLPGWRVRVLARRIQAAAGAGCAGCAAQTTSRPHSMRR